MPHHTTVFRDVLKLVPWARFEALVEDHDADVRVRRLPTKVQFIALLYGQLSGASGLREIVTGLSSHAARLYHLGAKPVRRSTFSDANANRPCAVFTDLLAVMMKQAHRGLRRKVAEAVYLIDSTSLRLNSDSADWAQFSTGVCGAKAHVIYDADADRPLYAAVTAANVNDITAAHQMPIEPGATYVFDLGYYDYLWWATLDAAGCRIVTRLKSNTPLNVIEELAVIPGRNILSDRIGFLPARQAGRRRNPMQQAVREVRIIADTGKVLRILSNDLDASAEDIANLYRRRWAIIADDGPSSCSSAGSSKRSRSPASSEPPRTPCASRSPSPSSLSCCCGWPKPLRKPFEARSSSQRSSVPTSCTKNQSPICSSLHPYRQITHR
jgi:hypothetical protein